MKAFILLVTATLTLVSWWLLNTESRKQPSQAIARNTPDFWIENFTTSTLDEQGQLKNQLHATYLVHLKMSGDSLLENPHLVTHGGESTPWQIRAIDGKLSEDNQHVFFGENVTIWREESSTQRPVTLHTSMLNFDSRTQQFFTDKHSKFSSLGDTIEGTSMTGQFKPDLKMKLHHSVSGRVNPNN